MGNINYQFQNIGNQLANVGTTIDTIETRIFQLEQEIRSLHDFLDSIDIPRFGSTYSYGSTLTVGERLKMFKEKDSRFESLNQETTNI